MSELSESAACLRLSGDDLVPDEITALLGCEPTRSDIMGKPRHTPYLPPDQILLSRTGSWRLDFKRRRPGDLDGQIEEILELLTKDLEVWRKLSQKYRIDMFCGLWLESYNEGISLSVETLKSLSDRYIFIDFDIYHRDDEEE